MLLCRSPFLPNPQQPHQKHRPKADSKQQINPAKRGFHRRAAVEKCTGNGAADGAASGTGEGDHALGRTIVFPGHGGLKVRWLMTWSQA